MNDDEPEYSSDDDETYTPADIERIWRYAANVTITTDTTQRLNNYANSMTVYVRRLGDVMKLLPTAATRLPGCVMFNSLAVDENTADEMSALLEVFRTRVAVLAFATPFAEGADGAAWGGNAQILGWAAAVFGVVCRFARTAPDLRHLHFGIPHGYFDDAKRFAPVVDLIANSRLNSLSIAGSQPWMLSESAQELLTAAVRQNSRMERLVFAQCDNWFQYARLVLPNNMAIQGVTNGREVPDDIAVLLRRNQECAWPVVAKRLHEVFVSMAPIDLPAYVLLWIFDFSFVEHQWHQVFVAHCHWKKIELLVSYIALRRRLINSRPPK